MPRTVHRTPRHLDDPLRILWFTPGQWLLVALGLALLWAALQWLPAAVPTTWRLSLGLLAAGLPLALGYGGGGGRPLGEWPRRFWHFVTTPTERVPGPPRRGPLGFATYDGEPHQEDLPDA